MDHGELGRKLREIREARRESQRSLAARTPGLTSSAVARIETGKRYPTLVTLEMLAKALRCEIIIDPGGTRCRKL
jgi:transcriptional regulator with XRE-family HTH domain